MKQGPHVLVILDGYGYRTAHEHNAIYYAQPPHITQWMQQYPHATLSAAGPAVGLLKQMIGNSEVGHITIGAGRRIEQPVSEIMSSIKNGSFYADPLLIKRFNALAESGKRLHLMGLLSDGAVHSHIDHVKALIKLAQKSGISDIIVHPFLDGRDVGPQTAAQYLSELEKALAPLPHGIIGTLHGRFYAMDRDNNWDRTEKSYTILTKPTKNRFSTWQEALANSYDKGITDEFFEPISLDDSAAIGHGDAIVFFNFRADRARQLTRAFIEDQFAPFATKPLNLLWMITFTAYHPDFPVDVLIRKKTVRNSFFDVLEQHEVPLFTIAETEKYAHVTYFFNGGREVIHTNETRVLIPSKRHYASYADCPEMSAPEITDALLEAVDKNSHTFYLVNYANADMVGHSGNFEATVQAISCLNTQLIRLYKKVVEEGNGTLYITADHGNAEDMWDSAIGQPRTAHTTNDVPFIMITKNKNGKLNLKELSDIAPFLLQRLGLPIPREMLKEHTHTAYTPHRSKSS